MLTMQNQNRRPLEEQGFTMVEVVVSMALFTVVLGAVLGVVTKLTGTLGNSNRRVVAANLATKQIESARSQKALDIPDGLVTRTELVGSTTSRSSRRRTSCRRTRPRACAPAQATTSPTSS